MNINQNLTNELNELQKSHNIVIKFDDDPNLANGTIEITKIDKEKKVRKVKKKKTSKTKKDRKKTVSTQTKKNEVKKDEAMSNPIKEIKNKKSGWWQN